MKSIIGFAFIVWLAQTGSAPAGRGTLWRQESKIAVAAADASDNRQRIDALLKLYSDFPENSRVIRNLAWAEQRAGNSEDAAHCLKTYAGMGMTLPLAGPIYAAMASSGVLANLPELDKNRSPITSGRKIFELPDSDLIAENIAFDAQSRRYLVTSAREKKIVSCDDMGKCKDVVVSSPAAELDGMLAIHVDAKRNLLWATTAGMTMQLGFRPERKSKSALLKFDLRTFRLLKRYEPDDGKEHALGDMTVASNGDAYVADGLSGDIYIVKNEGEKLEPLVPAGVFVSPQTPTLNKTETALYVPDYDEGIAVIELATGKIKWLKTTSPIALDAIDGLY